MKYIFSVLFLVLFVNYSTSQSKQIKLWFTDLGQRKPSDDIKLLMIIENDTIEHHFKSGITSFDYDKVRDTDLTLAFKSENICVVFEGINWKSLFSFEDKNTFYWNLNIYKPIEMPEKLRGYAEKNDGRLVSLEADRWIIDSIKFSLK